VFEFLRFLVDFRAGLRGMVRVTLPRLASHDRIVPVSRLTGFTALLLVLASAPARADGFVTPFIGDNFGGNSSNCAGLTSCSPRRTNYGVSVGGLGTSLGFEEDLSYTKNFFGAGPGAETSVFSAMSNVVFPGASGKIQAYVVSGVGLVRASVALNQTSVVSNVIGYDLGGGVNTFFTTHLGIRGDIRYFHTFQDVNVALLSGKLGFWRASVGLTLKF
jgi:hypothetical protein